MNYTVTKYPAGTFSWADVSSTDITVTKKFMTSLMGWTSTDMPAGNGMDYTMFYVDGKTIAGGSAMPPDMAKAGVPSMWNSYVTVERVDETVKKAEGLGGKIAMPVMDVLDAGRMAGIMDPTGAALMVWEPKKHIGAELVNTVGCMCWNELYTKDMAVAKSFYSKLFGWTFDVDEKSGYVTIKNNGRPNGAMMTILSEMGTMLPNWTVYSTVNNIEESIAKAKDLGGRVYMGPKDTAVGKIAMVADPSGASFMIIEMSVPPQEWEEELDSRLGFK